MALDCDLVGGDMVEGIRASYLLLLTSEYPAFYWCAAFLRKQICANPGEGILCQFSWRLTDQK